MSTPAWSAYDEGYLRAYQWSGSLAAGSPLPQEAATVAMGPGELTHLHVSPIAISGFFGENQEVGRSFFLIGGPVGLAVTGAASYAHHQSKKRQAEQAAIPRWHNLGTADLVMTNQRLVVTNQAQSKSLLYAEAGPLAATTGANGVPAVQLQPANMPVLQFASPWAPMLYVFVHYLVDGQAPGVPIPDGLLDRARAEGRY